VLLSNCVELCLPCDCSFRWNESYIEAKLSMEDRAAKLETVAELVEKDLVLLGCTAIEDKLQEGVPQTIKTLAEAGIRLWVLTGDKMVSCMAAGGAGAQWRSRRQEPGAAHCAETEKLSL
jgi:hypothetical protein